MKKICCSFLMFGFTAGFLPAAVELIGAICGEDQEPISGLTVSALGDSGSWTTTTEIDGSFAFNLPEEIGLTVISIDPVGLSEGGFGLIPDFIWEPTLVTAIPIIELIELVPEISFERMEDGRNCVTLNFEWASGAAPITLRNYCIERSHDMIDWTPVMHVGVACPPIEFFDETQEDEPACYYRLAELESFFMPEVPEVDWGFIADPMVGWVGDPILFFNEGASVDWEFASSVPIIAPEIHLLPFQDE